MRTEFWWTNHLRDQDGVPLFRSVRKFSRSDHQIRYVCLSVCPSIRPYAWKNSASAGQIFIKFEIWGLFENLSRKLKFYQNVARMTGTLHEDESTFIIISRCILLRMGNVSGKNYRKKLKHIWCSITFFLTKIVQLVRYCEQMLYIQVGSRRQYNMAHTLWMLDTYG
jgi:hypothetical protein